MAKSTPTTTLTRRTALALAAGASAAVAVPVAAAATLPATAALRSAGDPIFLAINAHKLALAELVEASTLEDTARVEEIDRAALREAVDRTADELGEAQWALATTVPTTLAGALAALEYQRSKSSAVEELFGWTEERNAFALSIETAIRNAIS
jgi:hypothetical protein